MTYPSRKGTHKYMMYIRSTHTLIEFLEAKTRVIDRWRSKNRYSWRVHTDIIYTGAEYLHTGFRRSGKTILRSAAVLFSGIILFQIELLARFSRLQASRYYDNNYGTRIIFKKNTRHMRTL